MTNQPRTLSNPDRLCIYIPSHGEQLAAWFCPAAGSGVEEPRTRPTVICAGGLGAVKEMRMPAFMRAFSAAGYHSVAFDYRFFGESTGQPRQLLNYERQQEDWDAVIAHAQAGKIAGVDSTKLAIFGTSFGGGHVIHVASRHAELLAAISQCPFTDGLASSQTVRNPIPKLYLGFWGVCDLLWPGQSRIKVPLAAKDGRPGLMNAPDVYDNYIGMLPEGFEFDNMVAARIALRIPFLRPGTYASQVQIPILFAICAKDSVAPAAATKRYAESAPKGEIKLYEDEGHFDLYQGAGYEKATRDYAAFLRRHLGE